MRAVWARLAQDDKALLQRAYSLDGVAEELLFVSGPLLVGVLVGAAAPAVGIVVGAALMVAGTAGFVRSPAVRAVRPAGPSPRRDSGGRRVLHRVGRPVVAAAHKGTVTEVSIDDDNGTVAWSAETVKGNGHGEWNVALDTGKVTQDRDDDGDDA